MFFERIRGGERGDKIFIRKVTVTLKVTVTVFWLFQLPNRFLHLIQNLA